MADLTISIDLDASGLPAKARVVNSQIKGIADNAEATGRRTSSLAAVDFSRLQQHLAGVGDKLKMVGRIATTVGLGLTTLVTAPIVGIGLLGAKFVALRERAELSFKVLLRDGEKAKALMKDLTDFADKTPFESQPIIEAGRLLVAYGVDAQNVKSILTDLGDTAAAMDANIVDVARAFGRLKAGDFGEAFERFRDFGVSRELLEAKGLKFDKSGQYLGSVEQAMEAVRGVMKEKFGGTMDELSNSFGGKLSTFTDKLKGLLIAVFEPVLPVLSSAVTTLTSYVEKAVQVFQNLPQGIQTGIVAFLGLVAALGPVLVIIGSVVTAIGGLVTAISTIAGGIAAIGGLSVALPIILAVGAAIGVLAAAVTATVGVVYALVDAWQNGFGPVVTIIALVVTGIISALLPVFGLPLMFAAIGVSIYEAWSTNFGGLRDFTDQVWEFITSKINTALTAIRELTAEVVGEVVNWWNENYPLIEATVTRVSSAIEQQVRAFLDALRSFWSAHGEQITAVVKAAWTIISTVVRTGVQVILGVVKIAMQIINGDWAGAWNTYKSIVQKAVSAFAVIVGQINKIVWNALKLVVTTIVSIGTDIQIKVLEIGKNIILGLANGMLAVATAPLTAAKNIATGIIGVLRGVPKVESPSKVTTEIGQQIGEGLALGIESKIARTSAAAKKMAAEVIKQLRDAVTEFQKLAGASPETVAQIQETNRLREGVSKQQEIIKLRGELGVGSASPLPDDLIGTDLELNRLRKMKEEADEFAAILADLDERAKNWRKNLEEAEAQRARDHAERIAQMQQAGEIDLIRLRAEIDLLGVTDERERRRIQNAADLLTLREQLKNDGFAEDQVNEAVEIARVEQARRAELERIRDIRKQTVEAGNFADGLMGQFEQLRNGNRELSEYEKTLRKIQQDYKDISPEQREHLLNLAKQIDAQKAYNDQYAKLYDFIRGTFDVLADSSKSWGERLKSIFDNILGRFKKMVLDMAAAWLSSKLMGMMGLGGGQGQGGGVGGFLQQILGLGGGAGPGGTPNWNPAAGGSPAGLPGGISGSVGVTPPGSSGTISGTVSGGTGTNIAGGGFFGSLKDLFKPSRNPITGKMNSQLAGTLGGIGAIASVVGGFIPGKWGNVVSMAGMGMSIGAMFGGGLGAAIGAGIGAIAGLFMGDPKKKRDKKEKMPQLEKGFADAMMELRRLLSDRNALLANPDGIVAQAMDIRNQIKNGFGIQMESKKYQKIMKERIAVNLERADELIKQIKDLAEVYRAANDRERRMIPEFASGGFPRPGQVALVGERGPEFFVPHVAGRVISNAETQQILTGGGSDINVTVVVQQDEQGRWNAMAQTDSGKRIVARVVTDGFRNDEIKTARRAG